MNTIFIGIGIFEPSKELRLLINEFSKDAPKEERLKGLLNKVPKKERESYIDFLKMASLCEKCPNCTERRRFISFLERQSRAGPTSTQNLYTQVGVIPGEIYTRSICTIVMTRFAHPHQLTGLVCRVICTKNSMDKCRGVF